MKIIWYDREIVKNHVAYKKGPLYTFFRYWKYQHFGEKVWSYLTPYKKTKSNLDLNKVMLSSVGIRNPLWKKKIA